MIPYSTKWTWNFILLFYNPSEWTGISAEFPKWNLPVGTLRVSGDYGEKRHLFLGKKGTNLGNFLGEHPGNIRKHFYFGETGEQTDFNISREQNDGGPQQDLVTVQANIKKKANKTKVVFGVFDRARFKPVSSATETRLKIEISSVAIKFRYATNKKYYPICE